MEILFMEALETAKSLDKYFIKTGKLTKATPRRSDLPQR
jgi:hypothetical protein